MATTNTTPPPPSSSGELKLITSHGMLEIWLCFVLLCCVKFYSLCSCVMMDHFEEDYKLFFLIVIVFVMLLY